MRKSLAAGIGLVVGSVIALSIIASCGKDVVGPTTSPTVVATQDPMIPAPNQPVGQPAIVNPSAAYDVSWSERASWQVGNRSADTLYYKAQYTDFDNQALVRGSQDLVAAPGTTSHGTFDKTCVQVDLLTGGSIFAAAFFGKDGRQFNPSNEPGKVDECRPKPTPSPSPDPSPDPSPTPTPCPSPTPKPHGSCQYTIDCGKQDAPLAALNQDKPNYCVNHSEQAECAAGDGVWTYRSQGSKCVTPFPGISNARWQLNPGQSDHDCLDKHDHS